MNDKHTLHEFRVADPTRRGWEGEVFSNISMHKSSQVCNAACIVPGSTGSFQFDLLLLGCYPWSEALLDRLRRSNSLEDISHDYCWYIEEEVVASAVESMEIVSSGFSIQKH